MKEYKCTRCNGTYKLPLPAVVACPYCGNAIGHLSDL